MLRTIFLLLPVFISLFWSVSLRSHIWFLIIPEVLGLIYGVAILITPMDEFKAWLYDENVQTTSMPVQFLEVMRKVIRLTVLIQLVITVIANGLPSWRWGHSGQPNEDG